LDKTADKKKVWTGVKNRCIIWQHRPTIKGSIYFFDKKDSKSNYLKRIRKDIIRPKSAIASVNAKPRIV